MTTRPVPEVVRVIFWSAPASTVTALAAFISTSVPAVKSTSPAVATKLAVPVVAVVVVLAAPVIATSFAVEFIVTPVAPSRATVAPP